MNRRGFFKALLAPFLACLFPAVKPKPLGVHVRMVRYFDSEMGRWSSRMDVLYGYGVPLRADYAVRIEA